MRKKIPKGWHDYRNNHHKKTFREKYIAFLEKFEINYNEKYLFESVD